MCDIMSITNSRLAVTGGANMLSEFGKVDAVGSGSGGEAGGGVAVNKGVFVLTEAVDGVGLMLCDAEGRVCGVAREGFGVALAGGEVVVVVVEGFVPVGGVWGDVGDGVEGGEEGGCGCEVGGPVFGGAGGAVGCVEGGGGWAGVLGFEGVDVGGLDVEGDGGLGVWVHAVDEHAGDLRGDDVVGDAVGDLLVGLGGEEV